MCWKRPPEPDFYSEEGKERRRKGLANYRTLGLIQFPLGILATMSGAATLGLAIENPAYPFTGCFPFVVGVLTLVGSIFAYKASGYNVDEAVPACVKTYIMVNYGLVMSVNCGIGGLAIGNSGWGIGLCASNNEKCTPNRDAKFAMAITDTVFCSLITFTIWATLCNMYKYGRAFFACKKSGDGCMTSPKSDTYK